MAKKIIIQSPRQPLWKNRKLTAIHAELTDKCNSACPMCPRFIDNGAAVNPLLANTEITLEQIKQWFSPKFVRNLKKFLACGNYGDPIAARETLEIFKYLRECNSRLGLAMNTNGSARNREWWAEMGKIISDSSRGDYCTFSIDGLGDTNALYRRNTNFEKIMENAQAFISAGGEAHWDYIVFDYNEHQVEAARSLAIEMGFTNFNVKRTTRWSQYNANRGEFEVRDRRGKEPYMLRQPQSGVYRDETLKVLRENLNKPNYVTEQEFDKLFVDDQLHAVPDQNGGHSHIRHSEIEVQCRAVSGEGNHLNEFFISATGHMFPCCFLGGEPWRHSRPKNSSESFLKMIELNGGMETIDLNKNKVEEIVATPLYSEMLRRSFSLNHPMRSRQCSTCCGRSWNKLDYGELGDKNASALGSTAKKILNVFKR